MSLEAGSYINDLNVANPTASDAKSAGDDHLRLLKAAVKNCFPGFAGSVLVGGTDTGAVNAYVLAPATALVAYATNTMVVWTPAVTNTSAATINVSGLGVRSIKRVDGTALAANDLVAGRYVAMVDNGTEYRLLDLTKNYVDGLAFATALPGQAGNAGKYVTTDGTTASWSTVLPTQAGNANKFLKTDGTTASWAASGIGSVTNIVAATTLTSANLAYHTVAMTALGQSVTLPDATTLAVGTPKAVFKNTGGYPFGIRDSTGVLLMSVAAGGVAYVSLDSISTAAGSWSITGTNLEPGLITLDNQFSATYTNTSYNAFLAIDDSTSLHFLDLTSGGLAAFILDNTGKVVTTPVTISTTLYTQPRAVFKVSATTFLVFYGDITSTTSHFAVVLTLSGTTPSYSLTVGTPQSLVATMSGAWDNENFLDNPRIASLTATTYLASFVNGANTSVAAITVSGATVTIGAIANIITASAVGTTTTYSLTATTGLVVYKSGAAAPYSVNAVVITVTGSTCAVGSSVVGLTSSVTNAPGSCLLSATKLVVGDNANTGSASAATMVISGTGITAGAILTVEAGISGTMYYSDGATINRYCQRLFPVSATTCAFYYADSTGISRTVLLTDSAGTISKGTILYGVGRAGSGIATSSPQYVSTTDYLITTQRASTADGGYTSLTPVKLSSGAYVSGASAPTHFMGGSSSFYTWRLSGGTYVTTSSQSGQLLVTTSNGDYIKVKGVITTPMLVTSGTVNRTQASPTRLALLAQHSLGSSGAVTAQVRLINVEIAA